MAQRAKAVRVKMLHLKRVRDAGARVARLPRGDTTPTVRSFDRPPLIALIKRAMQHLARVALASIFVNAALPIAAASSAKHQCALSGVDVTRVLLGMRSKHTRHQMRWKLTGGRGGGSRTMERCSRRQRQRNGRGLWTHSQWAGGSACSRWNHLRGTWTVTAITVRGKHAISSCSCGKDMPPTRDGRLQWRVRCRRAQEESWALLLGRWWRCQGREHRDAVERGR